MAKLTRFVCSQNAHHELRQKAYDIPGTRGEILYRYHQGILKKQKHENRIIPLKERRKIFASISNRVVNRVNMKGR